MVSIQNFKEHGFTMEKRYLNIKKTMELSFNAKRFKTYGKLWYFTKMCDTIPKTI